MTPTEIAQGLWAKIRAKENLMGDYTRAHWAYVADEHRNDFVELIATVLADGVVTSEELVNLYKTHFEGKGWAYGTVQNFNAKTSPKLKPVAELDTKEAEVFDATLTEIKTLESTLSTTELDAVKILKGVTK